MKDLSFYCQKKEKAYIVSFTANNSMQQNAREKRFHARNYVLHCNRLYNNGFGL